MTMEMRQSIKYRSMSHTNKDRLHASHYRIQAFACDDIKQSSRGLYHESSKIIMQTVIPILETS